MRASDTHKKILDENTNRPDSSSVHCIYVLNTTLHCVNMYNTYINTF